MKHVWVSGLEARSLRLTPTMARGGDIFNDMWRIDGRRYKRMRAKYAPRWFRRLTASPSGPR